MVNIFKQNSVVCAVRTEEKLVSALKSESRSIFLLNADINTISDVISRCHDKSKRAFIHIDLANGFGRDEATVEYLAKTVKPDGILSTKSNIVKFAKEQGLTAILRVFLIDAQSMDSAIYNIGKLSPDAVEIMPGIAYEAITELKKQTGVEIIAGGFVRTRQNAVSAFQAGANACSSSSECLWNLNF